MAKTDTSKQPGRSEGGGARGPGADDEQKGPLDVLRENAGLMITVLLAAVAISLALVYRSNQAAHQDDQAWRELGALKKEQPEGTDGFAELAERYDDTQAGPYIKITWASRLYATGVRENVEQAADLLEEVHRANPDHFILSDLLPGRIERMRAELDSDAAFLHDEVPEEPGPEEQAPPFPGGGQTPAEAIDPQSLLEEVEQPGGEAPSGRTDAPGRPDGPAPPPSGGE